MCGIIGYVGNENKTLSVLIEGLTNLEYRGYDSAGIAYVNENSVKLIKSVGKIINLKEKINFNIETNIGIGHTRWATHGEVNEINCHPHNVGKITLVHNGIIENYLDIKNKLETYGYIFKTKTDTEVVCALIDKLYNELNDIKIVLKEIEKILIGSYALVIIVSNDKNIYVIKNHSPLIIGLGNNENFVSSDVPAILKYTNKYIVLNDLDYAIVNNKKVLVYSKNGKLKDNKIKKFTGDLLSAEKCGYKHFMLKEINEQVTVFKNNISLYFNDGIKTLISKLPDIGKYEKIDIVACGSANHAGLVGRVLIEKYGNIEVNNYIASEYRYKKLFINSKTLVILISQSGETADTLASLVMAKSYKATTLAIVNVVDSSIAREADIVIYTNAGIEISVATTKAYFAQVLILSLLALRTAISSKKISMNEIEEILKEIKLLPSKIEKLLNNKDQYEKIAQLLYKSNDIYFLGRQIDYALSLEGSLKLKEISYIHSEAYVAGELKHGTISLIEKDTPVIGILTDINIWSKTISNIEETKLRGAKIITVITEKINKLIKNEYENIIIPDTNELFQTLLSVIPLQYIAYLVADLKKCDIDKPKNLAKSVTVE